MSQIESTCAEKIMLPFHPKPFATMYHHLAFPIGILQGHTQFDLSPWLSSKYINCKFQMGENIMQRYNIAVDDPWFLNDEIFEFQNVKLCQHTFFQLFGTYVTLLKKMLALGYYPNANYNEALLVKGAAPGSYRYHDFLLIGYDNAQSVFHSIGYLGSDHIHFFDIPFEIMEKAIRTLKTSCVELCFWKVKPEATFDFHIKEITEELQNYLHSTVPHNKQQKNYCYGLDAQTHLGNHFKSLSPGNQQRDRRYTRGFAEHKFFMRKRIEYLTERNYLSSRSALDHARVVEQIGNNIHLLALKFYATSQHRLLEKMEKLVYQTVEIEQQYLSSVLLELTNGEKR